MAYTGIMTKPIEIIHQNFECKLETIRNILQVVDPEGKGGNVCRDARQQVAEVAREYQEQTLECICDYHMASDLKVKCQTVDRYMQIVVSKNFVSKLDQVVAGLRDFTVNRAELDAVQLSVLLKKYQNTPINTDVRKLDYKTCPNCKGKMTLDGPRSELRCTKCDYTLILKGMMYDESHMYSNDGSLAKRGAYETSRHCRYHLERILAIKNPNIPESVIGPGGKIDKWLERNNIRYMKLVTCEAYRRCLKEIDETKYNEHVPYIRQVKSGVSPERLFHHEMRRLYILFEKAVTRFNDLKADERANLKYYPYFIFKIVEIILVTLSNNPDDERRFRSIVSCIHFQRDNTIVANDRLWEQICKDEPDLPFNKTDRNLLGIE